MEPISDRAYIMNMHTNVDGIGNSPKQTNHGFFYIVFDFLRIILYQGSEFAHFQIILLTVNNLMNLYKFD